MRECDAVVVVEGDDIAGEFSTKTGSSRGYPKPGHIEIEVDCTRSETGGCGLHETCRVESFNDVARVVGNLLLEECPNFRGVEMRSSREYDPELIASNIRRCLIAGSILYFATRDEDGGRQWSVSSVSSFDYGGDLPINFSESRSHFQRLEEMGLVELTRTTGTRQTARWAAEIIDSELWDEIAQLPEVIEAIELIDEAVTTNQVVNVRQQIVSLAPNRRR